MIQKFLSAKHWQLFALILGLPIIFQFFLMGSLFSGISKGNPPGPDTFFSFFKFFPLLMLLTVGTYFGWFWSIAVGLDKKIPEHLKLKLNRFKVSLFIPLIYMFLFMGFMGSMMSSFMSPGSEPPFDIFAIIFPLHLLSMFCMFYALYFVAKTIKTAELQRKVTFGDFAGEFFLIWFYPVGIWIVQPKINELAKEEEGGLFV